MHGIERAVLESKTEVSITHHDVLGCSRAHVRPTKITRATVAHLPQLSNLLRRPGDVLAILKLLGSAHENIDLGISILPEPDSWTLLLQCNFTALSTNLSPNQVSGLTSDDSPTPLTALFTRSFMSAFASVVLLHRICLPRMAGLKQCRLLNPPPARGYGKLRSETPELMMNFACPSLAAGSDREREEHQAIRIGPIIDINW